MKKKRRPAAAGKKKIGKRAAALRSTRDGGTEPVEGAAAAREPACGAEAPSARRRPASTTPPDQERRELILSELDRSMLVEAAAGTGKTTSMIGRMLALVAAGKCRVETLAAVTFTRKAAAELRSRFRIALEGALREAEKLGARHAVPLRRALRDSARCFVGTIHSFCARLLRERPVEAGVDVDFEEIDEETDARLRALAWDEYVAYLYAESDPVLAELAELGLEPGELRAAFMKFADYPDVAEWPAEPGGPVDLAPAREALVEYARHMASLAPTFPEDKGNDKLMAKYETVHRMVRQADLENPVELAEVLGSFTSASVVQKEWPGGKDQAKRERDRWNEFAETFARPVVERFFGRRYAVAMRALHAARGIYDRWRLFTGKLNFQDLLMKAAGLLRDQPHVRRYFRERFTHLLVDEFQDTDPIQAEVMLLLTADSFEERDWRRCRPVPGSLFVVGDPKQSIYRFRRADIVTYNTVRDIVEKTGGMIVPLSANFRTGEPVVDWVNGVFEGVFPEAPNECSPAHVPLRSARADGPAGELSGVRVIDIPEEHSANKNLVAAWEPALIARIIRNALDSGATVTRSKKDLDEGASPDCRPGSLRPAPPGPDCRPGDFMIVTARKQRLGAYARALGELGVPHQVTGGSALNDVRELGLLHACLRAATEPAAPGALVAALRGELFGLSDAALYAFKRAGGEFSFRSEVPGGLDDGDAAVFADAFERLRKYAKWLQTVPPAAAAERVAADLGLFASAAAGKGGALRAGSLAKAIELLRAVQSETWNAADVVEYLGRLARGEEPHDGASVREVEGDVVRVMNLHKVKGLEAPVVFLADPVGKHRHEVELHVDRSGPVARGHMALYGESAGYHRPLLARPAGWEELAEVERRFVEAEEQRLLYVAATRAGSQLVITRRAKGNHANPWRLLTEHLERCEALEDPGPQRTPAVEAVDVADREVADARSGIRERWSAATRPGYSLIAAREAAAVLGVGEDEASKEASAQLSLVGPESPEGIAGEHGTEWGSVIHTLLQAAMAKADADLRALARAALDEEGLAPSLADDAVATVKSVTGSDIWRRARESGTRLVEVPFQLLADAEGTPTLVRGVIDLAFREKGGWVIVDYKTDRADAGQLTALVERYRPQLLAYAEAWRRAVGEPVAETGLFFVRARTYVKC